jgi:G:T-mismatch repair DNA endonuclease (very short patch repair protein)
MGEIIPFRAAHRRRAPVEPPQGPAQILFFLGVRYRKEDADLDGPPSNRSGSTRSRQK